MASFEFNDNAYRGILEDIANYSSLYTDNSTSFIHYRTLEKIFVCATNGKDIAKMDKVFDAIVGPNWEIGVGVKTFTLSSDKSSHSFEKVQELTKFAGEGHLKGLNNLEIVKKVSEYRNKVILNTCREFNVSVSQSIYHCFVRQGFKGFIHEEPYPLINVNSIQLTDKKGTPLPPELGLEFPASTASNNSIFFTDGLNLYRFTISKSVLYKKFVTGFPLDHNCISLKPRENIWEKLLAKHFGESAVEYSSFKEELVSDVEPPTAGVDFVILPLYSVIAGVKTVPVKSGINQWNASGRDRKFGEAYIPIPSKVRKLAPEFFPPRDVVFSLTLPGLATPASAKVCQENGKALMTSPNNLLCQWLYKVIDPSFSKDSYSKPPSRDPFTYADLEDAGFDSAIVYKSEKDGRFTYEISFAEIGSYENFIQQFETH